MREKKQQFSIKKLTTGVASICIGFSFLIVQVSADDTVNDSKITNIHQQIGEYEKIELNDKLDQVISENQENEIVHDLNIENQDAIESSKDLSQELDVDINKIDILENSNTNISLETNEKKSNPLTQFFKVQESMDKSQNAIDFIDGNVTEFSDEIVIEQLNATKKVALKNLLLSDFEKTAPEIAIRDFTKKKQSSKDFKPQEITKYFSPIIIKLRQEAQKSQENFDNMALIQQAWEMAIQKANEELYDDYHLASLAQKAKKNFQNILMPTNNEGILESQPHLTIKQLKQDLHQLFRGILFLQEQYSFEEDLPQRLVFSPESIGAIKKGPETAYQRLLSYGARVNDKRQMALSLNETHFKTHKIGQYTGTSSPIDLFEKLAIEKHKDPSSYFEERTEALVGASRGNNVYSSIKNHKSHYLLPILSQGKGLYIAGTSNSITIGLIATYTKDYPEIENYFHQRGSEQINEPFFNDIVNYQENWLQFLDTVKKPGTQVPFTEALDSMYIYHKDGTRTWSSNEGDLADIAVVHFFNPMRLWQSYSKSGVGLGGQKQSASSIRSFETLFMAKDLSGLGLFTHEMTHANDEERLFGGKYNEHGRRSGQGPEVYARGLFEDIDNTQEGKDGEFKPVFSLNTTIPIGNKTNRVQASQPQNTRIKLETYMKNLMDLVAYLEVKEAEAALNVLSPREKNIYFNHIEQVSAINDSERQQLGSHQTSSNDAIIPFDKATDNIQLGNPMTIEDLVEKNAVSGQFIATGTSPFILNLKHNQYNQVPLLESFYGSQVALDGKNTVGDISFKRHAYEILGWKGWDAFVDYLSDKYNSDQAAFASILKGSYNNQWIQFKKERYQQLAQKKPIQNLWDDQLLLEDLKIAVIKDLAEIKKIKDISSEIFENSSISDSEKQTQLAVIAARQQFYKKATNVRAVKLNILQKALAFNDLTSAILSSPITSVPLVSPQALDLPTADIRYEEIDYDTREILDPSLAKGEEVIIQVGRKGRRELIFVNGQEHSTKVILPAVAEEKRIGQMTFAVPLVSPQALDLPTADIRYEEIDYDTREILDPSLAKGEEVITQVGRKGRRELIFVNGQEHSTKVILPAVAEEKRIGQMTFAVPLVSPQTLDLPTADIRYEEIDYDTREILDPSLAKGEEVITQVGRKGRRELIFVNGQEHSTKVILPAVAEEKRIGQMTFAVPLVSPQALDLPTADIRYEEIDYDTREILDPSLAKGEEVITQVGRKGRRELIFVNGQEHSTKVILPAVAEEKRIGQMTFAVPLVSPQALDLPTADIRYEEIDYDTREILDPSLAKGEEVITQVGRKGRRELIFVNGQEHSTKVILPAVAEEKRIGQMTFAVPLVSPQALDLPTADIRYEEIDYDTREILDPSLSKGEEVITQVGRKGRRELIFVNGQEHSIKVILPAVTEEKRIGQMEREIFLLLNNKNKAVQRELPKTGDDNSNSFKMTGFLLITLLSLFWIKKKQYRKISN